jgi:succinoglycan biosynthesis protein ExoM
LPSDQVVVAVVTFRRPAELARLLEALLSVQFPPTSRVLVVDNDPEGSARAIVDRRQGGGSGLRFEYALEPLPGIAAARNRAVSLCHDARFIVFIDDDEVPSPHWLEHLLDVQHRFDADLVAGPVLAQLEGATPWLARGGFFDRARRPTGPACFLASSANLLIRLSVTERLGDDLFDVRFGLTGGSDTLLSLRAQRAGLRLAWADEAEVTEFFPEARANVGWILRRAYRSGTTIARCEKTVAGSLPARFGAGTLRAAKGAAHVLVAVARFVPSGLARGRVGAVGELRRISLGLGMVLGAAGLRYVEYRRVGVAS